MGLSEEQKRRIAENCDEANINSILARLESGEGAVPAKAFVMRERPTKYTPVHITDASREASLKAIFGSSYIPPEKRRRHVSDDDSSEKDI